MSNIKKDNNNEILIKAVQKLQLRFPVAEIQRATGYEKGSISSFLNNKKPVSDNFLQTFSEAFKINLKEFGSFREVGKGNIGKFKDFIPAPTHVKRDTATKRWETIVKKGLGIDMNMYSMKKAGANALILANVSINAIKDLAGHTSEVTTQIYITNLKEINRKEILEKGTDF